MGLGTKICVSAEYIVTDQKASTGGGGENLRT